MFKFLLRDVSLFYCNQKYCLYTYGQTIREIPHKKPIISTPTFAYLILLVFERSPPLSLLPLIKKV